MTKSPTTPAHTTLAELLAFPAERCEQMLRAALERYADGDFHQAETILVGLITLNNGDARPLKLLASTCLHQGRHAQAESLYERALELDPDDAYTLVALGEIKLKALKIEEAVPLFERLFALDADGNSPPANRGRELVRDYHQRFADKG